jgi:hypothetical protein
MSDELMLLWQQGVSQDPDPAEVARLAGRASMTRFDKAVARRNLREYVAFVLIFVFQIWRALWGREYAQATLTLTCAGFAMAYLWCHHRRIAPLDPAANARVYQTAMLARIDHQIRLLSTVRYWYLLPLYIPTLWTFVLTWQKSRVAAMLGWIVVTGLFVFLAWLNERVGVSVLRAKRQKIAALYAE